MVVKRKSSAKSKNSNIFDFIELSHVIIRKLSQEMFLFSYLTL